MRRGLDRGRREFLGAAAMAVTTGIIAAPAIAMPRVPSRRSLALHNVHTGESLDLVYWVEGLYNPGAMTRIDWLLRDFHNGTVRPIDRRLLDLLATMRHHLGDRVPFEVLPGYRSPETNAMLARTTEGVATNSLHLEGQAIDIRVPGWSVSALHRLALSLKGGGVGYYPQEDFIHIDVGRVRYW